MRRLQALESLRCDAVASKLLKELNEKEYLQLLEFIQMNDHLDFNDFAAKANMWMVDELDKPRHHTTMWALATEVNGAVKRS